jgi:hypothetical protein
MQEETALKDIGAVRHRLSEAVPAPSSEVLYNPYKWWSGPSRIGRHRFDPEISLDGELTMEATKT